MPFHLSQLCLGNFLSSGNFSFLYLTIHRKKISFPYSERFNMPFAYDFATKPLWEPLWLFPITPCLSMKGIHLLVNYQVTFSASLWKENKFPTPVNLTSDLLWMVSCVWAEDLEAIACFHRCSYSFPSATGMTCPN